MKDPKCTICSGKHYKSFCFSRPQKPINKSKRINPIGKRGKKNQETTKAWRAQNTEWICYLRISPHCLIHLNKQTAVPEHVVAKVHSNQKDIHDVKKIRAACTFCNAVKGSRSLESLAKSYPQVKSIISIDTA